MGFGIEVNRTFGVLPQTVTEGAYGDHIPLIGRIFIDIGIAIGTIVAGVATGGTALPAIIPGLVGSAAGLAANTTIDVEEGNTDALTIGLDIGLPFATEALGAGIGQVIKNLPISETKFINTLTKALDKSSVNAIEKNNFLAPLKGALGRGQSLSSVTQTNIGKGTLEAVKVTRKGAAKFLKTINENIGTTITQKSSLAKLVYRSQQEVLNKSITNIENSIKSLTDILDKVTGSIRGAIAKLLPRLFKTLKQLKNYYREVIKVAKKAINPIQEVYSQVSKQGRALLEKNPLVKDALDKMKLKQLYFKERLQKQSSLSNAIISKFDLTPVSSTWLLGYKVLVRQVDDDGNILVADLIWFFVPEMTKHNGERGATPEPMGKRPVTIRGLTQDELATYTNSDSFGRFYLTEVANGQGNTNLFAVTGGEKGLGSIDDLKDNLINTLMNNSLSLIPGYSLVAEIGQGIRTFETLGNSLVSGTYGTTLASQITDWRAAVHSFSGPLINSSMKSINNIIQRPSDISTGIANSLLKTTENAKNRVPKSIHMNIKNGNI